MTDFIVLGIVAMCIVISLIYNVKAKKAGKSGCCSGCSSCPSKHNCNQ